MIVKQATAAIPHGGLLLPAVEVLSYNVELKDEQGFVGDHASHGRFLQFIEKWRKRMKEMGQDPFEGESATKIAMESLEELLTRGNSEVAGVLQRSIESFAHELAVVIRRFLDLNQWKKAERLTIGGFTGPIGKLVIGRASVLLKTEKIKAEVCIIHNDPNEAGLIGAVHLVPAWICQAYDLILAVDIGGTNIRVGIVRLNVESKSDLSQAKVCRFELWMHRDEKPSRGETVHRLVEMLKRLINQAEKEGHKLAPFIGVGCPGRIKADGLIEVSLPFEIPEAIPCISNHKALIIMHNDAVMQGLSELPFMRDVSIWGVFTIGTGFGNVLLVNRTTSLF